LNTQVLECSEPRGNGGRTKRVTGTLARDTRAYRNQKMDHGDLDADSGYLATDYGSQHCSANGYVITTWRSESNSFFLPLLPYSGADNRMVVRQMKAFTFSRTCAIASTADLGLLIDWMPSSSDTCSRSEFSRKKRKKKAETKSQQHARYR